MSSRQRSADIAQGDRDGAVTPTMVMVIGLGGLLALVPVVVVVRRGLIRKRLRGEAMLRRSGVRWRADGDVPPPSSRPRRGERRPRPPAASTISRLGKRLRALDERGAELTRRIPTAPSADWPSLREEAQALAEAYRNLHADAARAWKRAFPERAAARARQGQEDLERFLTAVRALTPRQRSQRPARPAPGNPPPSEQSGWDGIE